MCGTHPEGQNWSENNGCKQLSVGFFCHLKCIAYLNFTTSGMALMVPSVQNAPSQTRALGCLPGIKMHSGVWTAPFSG